MHFSKLLTSSAIIAIVSSYIKGLRTASVADLLLAKSGSVNLSANACDILIQSNKRLCALMRKCGPCTKHGILFNLTAAEVILLRRVQCQDDGSKQRSCFPCNSTKNMVPESAFSSNEQKLRAAVKDNVAKKPWKLSEKLKQPRLFMEEECGKQVVNRIYGGEIAELDEYPWMALLVYNSNEYGCAGVLISRRFVLTAAHCVFGVAFEEKKGLKAVRLGEYNTNTEPDCIQEISHLVCADPALDVGVEKVFVHPKYDDTSRDMQHDIALLRLVQSIQFTHFIMPICLPPTGTNLTVSKGTIFTVAGWGRTNLCKCCAVSF